MLFLIISSFVMIAHGRTLNSPDQLMPLLFASVNADDNGMTLPANGHNRLIVVIEHIIK